MDPILRFLEDNTIDIDSNDLKDINGIIVPVGFGQRGSTEENKCN